MKEKTYSPSLKSPTFPTTASIMFVGVPVEFPTEGLVDEVENVLLGSALLLAL